MVKLYYLAVLQKNKENNVILCECSELSDFGFFKRTGAKEFMRFSCRILVGRTDPGSKVSVREQMYVCHVFVMQDHLAAAAVTDDEYPHTMVHICLQDVLSDYASKWNSTASNNKTQYVGLKDFLEKYKDPTQRTDGLGAVSQRLDETEIVLHHTMEAVLRRGEDLDDLVAKTGDLSAQAKTAYKTARKTNACCQAF